MPARDEPSVRRVVRPPLTEHYVGRVLDADLVIFDCDGVLVDSERLTVEVEARLLTELGWSVTPDEVVARWMGRTEVAQLAEVSDRLGRAAAAAFAARCRAEVGLAFDESLTPVEGIVAVLDRLDELTVDACVASSGTPERIRHTLGLTGLWDRFEGRIFSAVDVAHGKPAPDLFLLAASHMNVDPSRCVVIEDSVPGVCAAVAAGMSVLGYAGGLAAPDQLAAAGAAVFGHMRELAG